MLVDAGERKENGGARSSPVDNFFRHAANQCCGGKFLLLRTRHILHELHGKRTNHFPLFLRFFSSPSLSFLFSFFLLAEGKVVMMAMMDACSRCVYPFEITDDVPRNTRTNKRKVQTWSKETGCSSSNKVGRDIQVRLSSFSLQIALVQRTR